MLLCRLHPDTKCAVPRNRVRLERCLNPRSSPIPSISLSSTTSISPPSLSISIFGPHAQTRAGRECRPRGLFELVSKCTSESSPPPNYPIAQVAALSHFSPVLKHLKVYSALMGAPFASKTVITKGRKLELVRMILQAGKKCAVFTYRDP